MALRRLALLFTLLASILPGPASAELARVETEFARVGIVAEHGQVEPGAQTRLVLDMTLEPGWHTYWENAGDSGEPVDIRWTLPKGVDIGPIDWPAPHRQPYPPLMNYGYEDSALFTMDVYVPESWEAGAPVPVSGEVYWLVCAEVCIPETGNFAFELPTGAQSILDDSAKDLFLKAVAQKPVPSPYDAVYQSAGGELRLRLDGEGLHGESLKDAYFFPAEWGVIDHAAPQRLSRASDGITLSVATSPEVDTPVSGPVAGILELTEATPEGDIRIALAIEAAPGVVAAGQETGGGLDLTTTLLFAFVGGLILNLMPCVFPVLALKAIGFAKSAHDTAGVRLIHGLAYTAGVMALFVGLAGAMIALKASGAAIGWGFQLQNPWIVAALAYLLFLVGLNLSGVFELNPGLAGFGDDAAGRGGASGAFFTGALAAIVATPCTAPFMATAIGAALTMTAAQTLAVFAALGFGLAAPFLLLSVVPGAARWLPKPGAWMVRLKEFLAFPMYASAVWLIWVLGSLAGRDAMALALVGCVLLALAAWSWHQARIGGGRAKLLGYGTAVLALVGALAVSSGFGDARPASAQAVAGVSNGPAEPFSAARLTELRAAQTPVFVNMTADWCITCKVNERVALGSEFERLLAENRIVYLKGDWTARDPEITALLQEFGRAGVPLYAVYPRHGDPMLLPQILTTEMVAEALGAV